MTYYILTKLNRNIIAAILAFLLLPIFTGDKTAAHQLEDPGGEQAAVEQSEPAIGLAAGTTFVVNSDGSAGDNNPGDDKCYTGFTAPNGDDECTLRAAIQQSNASIGKDTINFNVRNSNGTCPSLVTIDTSGTLLTINDPTDAGVTIDGYTQCGASPNNQSVGHNADIRIEIRGNNSGIGINIRSSNNTIKGLAIYRSTRNIKISGVNSPPDPTTNNTIQGNFIGSNASLSCCNFGDGVLLQTNADYNLIGGIAPRERNIFVGNNGDSIPIDDDSDFNVVIGNYVGVKRDGKTKGPGGASGFDIGHGSAYNWVGASPPGWITGNTSSALGWPPAGAEWPPAGWQLGDPLPSPDPNRNYDNRERNIISGNGGDGIELSHEYGNEYNHILNNYIGVGVDGTTPVGNGEYGITVEDRPGHNFIYDNVIVNNHLAGIRLRGNTHYNEIIDNYIGVAPDGVTPMGNGTDLTEPDKEGITISAGGQYNLIKHNIIANHPDSGIKISTARESSNHSHETFYNTITQNSIYNNDEGIKLSSGSGTSLIGNEDLDPPLFTSASLSLVEGTACANCLIELFLAQTNDSFDINNGGEGKTYIGQGTANGSGIFSINISVSQGDLLTATATDAQGNTSEFGPNIEATLGETPIGTVLLNGGTGMETPYNDVLAQFSAQDNVGVTGWRYWKDNESPPAYTNISPTTPFSALSNPSPMTLSDGLHTVYAQYKDGDGNQSTVYNATITIVNASNPSDPDDGQIIINNGAPYTKNPNLSLKLIAPIPTSSNPPFYTKDMKIGEDSLSSSEWEPYTVSSVWPLDPPPANSKTVTMVARYRDVNNTPTSSNVYDTILYDPVAPDIDVSFNSNTKVLNLTGTHDDDSGLNDDNFGVSGMRFYNQLSPGQDTGWKPYNNTYTWPYPGGAEIIVQVRDNAGNVAEESTPQIIPGPVINITYLPIIMR